MDYQCSVCNEKVSGDLKTYVDHTEQHIVEAIKSKHPDWVEEDGLCRKCLDYYKAELKGGAS